jgi:hypothetical protein
MRTRVSFAIEKAGLDLIYRQFNIPFLPTEGSKWFMTTVFDDITDEVLASMVCEFKNHFDVHMTVVITDPRALSRRLLRTVFQTLFSQAVRVTVVVDPRNDESIGIIRRAGFQYEGFLRRGLDGNRDGLIYGMLREDCKFLPGYQGGTVKHTDIAGEPYGFTSKTARPLRNSESPRI